MTELPLYLPCLYLHVASFSFILLASLSFLSSPLHICQPLRIPSVSFFLSTFGPVSIPVTCLWLPRPVVAVVQVDYRERLYASGRMPKNPTHSEGPPAVGETLACSTVKTALGSSFTATLPFDVQVQPFHPPRQFIDLYIPPSMGRLLVG